MIFPKAEDNGVFLECKRCGYKRQFDNWIEHTCSSCNYDKSIVILDQMVRGDEGMTTIFKCLNCGNIDKEGYKGY
jgi:DNA-directed RNA polymerase subunit M/transcription elongation factor TFIIS